MLILCTSLPPRFPLTRCSVPRTWLDAGPVADGVHEKEITAARIAEKTSLEFLNIFYLKEWNRTRATLLEPKFKCFSIANQLTMFQNIASFTRRNQIPHVLRQLFRKSVEGHCKVLVVFHTPSDCYLAAGGDACQHFENTASIEQTWERRAIRPCRPVPIRFFNWFRAAAMGDLGSSITFRVPVSGLIVSRFVNTLYLATAAIFFALIVAIFLSFLSARLKSRAFRYVIDAVVLVFVSVPRILLSLLVLMLTAFLAGTPAQIGAGSLQMFVLTATALGLPLAGIFLGQFHEQLTGAMGEDFVQLARAKGLSEWTVIRRHASRAALVPLITLLGLSIGALLGGSVIVETILGWPGIGSLMVSAVRGRDVPLVMGIVLFSSLAVWIGNLAAEILQIINDKRLGGSR